MTIEHFWRGSIRVREVVRIADTHPKPSLRGRWAEVTDEVTPDRRYEVKYAVLRERRRGVRLRFSEVSARHLQRTGERMPPEPVPRPMTTWASGEDGSPFKPWHDHDVVDEIEQYL